VGSGLAFRFFFIFNIFKLFSNLTPKVFFSNLTLLAASQLTERHSNAAAPCMPARQACDVARSAHVGGGLPRGDLGSGKLAALQIMERPRSRRGKPVYRISAQAYFPCLYHFTSLILSISRPRPTPVVASPLPPPVVVAGRARAPSVPASPSPVPFHPLPCAFPTTAAHPLAPSLDDRWSSPSPRLHSSVGKVFLD
jgi:hypothetical protein